MNKSCGIYKITNIINNKCYIGQSVNCERRLQQHKLYLNNNKHTNPYLQSVYNIHKDSFKFEIFYLCSPQDLSSSELYFIKMLQSFGENGYNLTRGGEDFMRGRHHTPEACIKISKAGLGRKQICTGNNKIRILNQCHKMNIINTGRKYTKEHCNNISKSKIGFKHSDKTKLKLSKGILQFDMEGNFIKEWQSAKIVSRILKISNCNICSCLKNNRGSAGGFIWKWKI